VTGATLLAEGLHRLGGSIAVDGRVSWFPPALRGEAPVSCYVFEAAEPVLVDTGLPVLEQALLAQLAPIVGDRRLSVFPTRPVEFDSIGNMGAVLEAFAGLRVWSDMPMHGLAGWQARFELPPAEADSTWPPEAGVEWLGFPDSVELDGGERRLEVIQPELRMLMTAWIHDPKSRTLFTSDMFSHVLAPAPGIWRLTDDDRDDTTVDDVADHHLAKHHWLAGADGSRLAREVEAVFAAREIETIAPTFGCVLHGRRTVERHLALLLDALRRFRSGSER
jgi:hypothetical protein